MALENCREILSQNLDPKNPDYGRLLAIKKDVTISVINAALKADERRFKQHNDKILEEILAAVKYEDKVIEGEVRTIN